MDKMLKPDLTVETEVIEEKSLDHLPVRTIRGLNPEVFLLSVKTPNLEIGIKILGPKARVGLRLQQRFVKK
jgi:hypothetical protein